MRTTVTLLLALVLVAGTQGFGSAESLEAANRADWWAEQAPASSEYDNLEAVLDTARGQIVIEFFHKDAPAHVEYFVKQARAGAYDGTTFHRMFKHGLIQGGDPVTKNPAARARYGTGGLNAGLPDEVNKNKHITGAVSAAMQVNPASTKDVKPGSSGSQFFIVIAAQPQLDSMFTVFGRVVEGIDVAADISTAPTNPDKMATERIDIKKVTIREKTPTVEQMKAMKATIETSLGNLKLEFMAEAAPNTTRAFIRYARSGMYDGTTFYRIAHKYYLEAGFLGDWPEDSPNRKRFFSLWSIPVEKSSVNHVRGTVSMLNNQDATSWYFFTITKDNPALDGRHVPFAKVVEGLDVIDKIAEVEVEGDKPKQRVDIRKVSVE
jgi:peptidyl-prolyl cis-trans isomerase B (cyclophilin B)